MAKKKGATAAAAAGDAAAAGGGGGGKKAATSAAAGDDMVGTYRPRPFPKTLSEFTHYMFDPVPADSIVFLRIFWGLVMFYEIYTFMEYGYAKANHTLAAPRVLFRYWAFEWVPRLTLAQWQIFMPIAALLAICFSVGLFYHVAAAGFFVMFSFIFLQCMTNYLNHFYLVIVLLFLYIFLTPNKQFSLDAALGFVRRSSYVPRWQLWAVRGTVTIVYVWAGVVKINEDWLAGEPLLHWMPKRSRRYPSLAFIFNNPLLAYAMSYSGMMFDMVAPFALLNRYTRWPAFAASMSFHGLNKFIFNIGIFPYMMTVITFSFFDADWPRQLCRALGMRRALLAKPPPPPAPEDRHDRSRPLGARRWLLLGFLATFMLQQIATPARHYFLANQVVWSEEGHRFSWRMKLRDKAGMTKYYYRPRLEDGGDDAVDAHVDPARPWKLVPLTQFLQDRQVRKTSGRPEMIHWFVDYFAKTYERVHGGKRPEVRVVCVASVNYRKEQFMIDPRVDLAAIPPWTWPAWWVVPLLPRGTTEHMFIPSNGKKTMDKVSKMRLYKMYDHLDIVDMLKLFENVTDNIGHRVDEVRASASAAAGDAKKPEL